MEPSRIYPGIRVFLRILLLSLPILLLFTVLAVVSWAVVGLLTGTEITDAGRVLLSIICGLIASLFIIAFHLKKEHVSFPLMERDFFVSNLQTHLEELGYAVSWPSEDVLVGRPSFRSWLVGGGIQAQVNGKSAKITGPKVCLEMLRCRLRLRTQLEKDRKAYANGRSRQEEHILKRVHIQMRVTENQLTGVQQEILKALAADGTDIVCEVNILAQNDSGIRQSILDGPVKEWLKQEQIHATVHQEPATRTHLVLPS